MAEPRPVTMVTNQVDGVLQDYLDQLLVTATTQTVMPEAEPAPAPVRPVALVNPVPEIRQRTETRTPVEVKVAAPAQPQLTDLQTMTPAAVTSATTQLNWNSSQGIECLIFKVAGLKLAIPLPLLGGVFTVSDKVTPLFGQAAWSLGVWQGDDAKLTIIDSSLLIMPERGISLKEAGYNFFIQLDRSPWALACQEICDTVTLMHDSIKWRGDASKRPWLAGTVIAEMCALLDVPGIMKLLEDQRLPASGRR